LIEFYSDRMTVCGKEFFHAETTTAVHGVRKITIYGRDGVYAAVAPFRTNLVKYMVCGYHLRNKILGVKEEYYGY
jgi:predicted SPOUT superfamily RNA methylase MTH1